MRIMGTVLWIAIVGVLLLATIFHWQDRLLYFPTQTTVERAAIAGLQAWPSSQDFRGLAAEPAGAVLGTAIVFHGNAGHAGDRAFYAHALTPLGWRVILAEYPGFGPRAGRLSEASLVADADETVALAHRQYGGPLLLIGESLGSAVAAAAAARQRDLTTGLLLITPWDRLAHVASYHYPWLPVKWLLRDEYDTQVRLAAFDRPVVLVIAEHDSIVPPHLGAALHAALAGSKLITIQGVDHNNWPDHVDATWWRTTIALTLGETS